MFFGLAVIISLSGYGIISQSAKQPPSYYQELLPPAPRLEANANQAISKVEQIKQSASQKNRQNQPKLRTTNFTQHEINAWLKTRWLASRSPKEKKVLKEVRIRLTENKVTAIAHLDTRYFEGYLTAECLPKTGPDKTLQIEVIKCYSGIARIPISQVRKRILSRIPDNFPEYEWPKDSQTLSIDLSNLVTAETMRPVVIKKVQVENESIRIDFLIE